MSSVKFELTYAAMKMFGKQLYSNVGAAVSELVANGIDAKAGSIFISIDISNKKEATVEIFDDGNGMSSKDISEKYIKIGFNKRTLTQNNDKKMLGRKGIGKLAALYLSDNFIIATKENRKSKSIWQLDVSTLEGNSTPELVEVDNVAITDTQCYEFWEKSDKGTLISLKKVDLSGMSDRAFESLEARLSNFFIIDEVEAEIHLNVFRNDEERGKFTKIQKKIAFKNMSTIYTDDVSKFEHLKNSKYKLQFKNKRGETYDYENTLEIKEFKSVLGEKVSGEISGYDFELKGWIGVHSSIKLETAERNDLNYIKNQFYNPNQLRIYTRSKLGKANMLGNLGLTGAFANYIEGEISFDILDEDMLEDIATAGRQDYDTQDSRFLMLRKLLIDLGRALVRSRQSVADDINRNKDDIDIRISSNAKKNFSEELHEELQTVEGIGEEEKAEIEAIVVNKIEGEIELEAKSEFTVFISHASKDKMISDCIYDYLKSLGFNGDLTSETCEVFYSSSGLDTTNLKPLSFIIRDFLVRKNNDILFLTSANFNNSPFCLFEGGAAWATRGIGEYDVITLQFSDIPDFLTNGKSEYNLDIKEAKDFILDSRKYTNLVKSINRIIHHLNKNRSMIGRETVVELEIVDFPNKVELKQKGKKVEDYMDKTLLEFWDTYVIDNAEKYIEDNLT